MQEEISTNIRIPTEIWRAVKIKAAQEGKTMKDLILEGIEKVLHRGQPLHKKGSAREFLLAFSGKAPSKKVDASIEHDRYLDEK